MKPYVRKEVVIIDEIRAEIGKPLPMPLRKCASVAIVENLFAGKRVEDLSLYGEYGEWLGRRLVENALEALGVGPEEIQSYGKAVVTGLAGEQEHGSALLHITFDGPVREALRDTLSIIPSTEKAGPAGCSVDVPLHSKRAVKVRTHYDAMEVSVADGPRPDEIMVVLCLTTGSRPFPRVGGLLLDQVKGVDGVS